MSCHSLHETPPGDRAHPLPHAPSQQALQPRPVRRGDGCPFLAGRQAQNPWGSPPCGTQPQRPRTTPPPTPWPGPEGSLGVGLQNQTPALPLPPRGVLPLTGLMPLTGLLPGPRRRAVSGWRVSPCLSQPSDARWLSLCDRAQRLNWQTQPRPQTRGLRAPAWPSGASGCQEGSVKAGPLLGASAGRWRAWSRGAESGASPGARPVLLCRGPRQSRSPLTRGRGSPLPSPLPRKPPPAQRNVGHTPSLAAWPAVGCNTHMAADAGWGRPSRPPQ